jgi:hypothetical protein
MTSFRFSGLDAAAFRPLFDLTEARLRALGAVRRTATERFGFPCRVSLEDAAVGEELLLLPYEHQPAASPYRASGPIFVRRDARRAMLDAGEVPACVSGRLISVRGYDADHCIVDADVCAGEAIEAGIARQFSDARVAYLHLHNAKRGCFSCRVDRA